MAFAIVNPTVRVNDAVKVRANFRMNIGEAPDEWTERVGRVARVDGNEVLVEIGHHEVWLRRARLQILPE